MAYVKNTWVDQKVERPRTYQRNENIDGSVTLIDDFGKVTELGTPVNADNLNHIEDGIAGVAIRIHNMTEVFAKDEWVKSGDKLYKSKQDQNKGHAVTESEWYSEVSLGGGLPVGSIFAHTASASFVPENSLPCDGTEYTKEQFPSLYTDWLNSKEYFDRSKIEVVGSPNITNDGNLSDVGRGSYVRTPFEFNPQGAWEINVKANIDTSIKQQIIGAGKIYHCVNLREEANGRLVLSLSSNGTSFDISDAMSSVQDRIQTNTDYFYKIKFDTKQYTVAISTDNKIWKTIITVNSSLKVIKDYLQLGLILDGNNPLVKGSIDLKQFSISVDGKEVYSPTTGKLETCTYEQYQQEITSTGECLKFGIDTVKRTFKVPTKKNQIINNVSSNTTAPVKGNGKAMVYTTGSRELSIGTRGAGSVRDWYTQMVTSDNNAQAGTTGSLISGINPNCARLGLTTNANNSGVVADLSNTINTKTKEIRYFVVVATGSIKQSEMDWSQWASSLQGKLNKDMTNLPVTNDIVIEHKINSDGSWYRKYKSGWLEQGGLTMGVIRTEPNNITFIKPFKNATYNVVGSCCNNKGDEFDGIDVYFANRTSTNVKGITNINGGQQRRLPFCWYACGQGV